MVDPVADNAKMQQTPNLQNSKRLVIDVVMLRQALELLLKFFNELTTNDRCFTIFLFSDDKVNMMQGFILFQFSWHRFYCYLPKDCANP